jgi:PQQ-dependent catabolism-associated CXXCW motif protein
MCNREGAVRRLWSTAVLAIALSLLPQLPVTQAVAAPSAPPEEPSGYRMDDYRSPVPKTLAGADVLTADEAEALWRAHRGVFIDVYPKPPKPPNLPAGVFWRDPEHHTIDGAHWLPNVGYGPLPDDVEAYFKTQLEKLSGGDRNQRLVFFCQKDCWMSWNAAKRALGYGYTNIAWFPDGTDGWQELGYPLVKVQAEP